MVCLWISYTQGVSLVRGTLVDMLHTIPFHTSLIGKLRPNGEPVTSSHILVYGSVEVHSAGDLGCIASNKKIGEETNISSVMVSKILSDLSEMGWVKVVMDDKNHRLSIIPLMTLTLIPSDVPPHNGLSGTHITHDYIDNILDNIKNNSLAKAKKGSKKKSSFVPVHDSKDINALILYFYSKIIPAVSPVFSEANRKAFDSILGLSTGIQEVRDTIDKAEKILSEPYNNNLKVSSIVAFAQKFKLIQSHVSTVKKTTVQTTKNF